MRGPTLTLFLACALLASLFAVRPSSAASVEVSSVYYLPATNSGTRQPRPPGSGGHFVTIPGSAYSPDPSINTTTVPVPTNPNPTIVIGSGRLATTYALAYVNISGGANGGITVFPPSPPDSVTVPVPSPAQNIVVQNVYFPVGGTGGACSPNATKCATAAIIDEFSETLGILVDDTFVNVFLLKTPTTLDASLTASGNTDGTVLTTSDGVQISALSPPMQYMNTPTGGIFDRWVTGAGGTIGSESQNLDVNAQTNDYALALYRSACPAGYYWNATSTISQCSAEPSCPTGEIFNTITHTCGPGCPMGQVCDTCPQCKYGCGLVTNSQGLPVWVCFAHKLGSP